MIRGEQAKRGGQVQDVMVGWQAISEYADATVDEVRQAALLGELLVEPRAEVGHLEAWVRLRRLRRKLADESVEFVSDAS